MKHLLPILLLSCFISLAKAQDTVKDIDGNSYRVVTIGSQQWMAENLAVTRYNDGTPIPLVTNNESWGNLTTGAYCVPQNNTHKYKITYGVLYNHHAVSDHRDLCPSGWHVPTASEWKILIDYLGGEEVAGQKMKDLDSQLWQSPVSPSSNSSGFSALPAGGRGRAGDIGEVGRYATWWSSTSDDEHYAWHWGVHPHNNIIRYNPGHKNSGFSVRCISNK